MINADGVTRDFDEINATILDLLARGKALYDDAAAALTEEAKAAGQIVCAQPAVEAVKPTLDPVTGQLLLGEDGQPVNEGTPGKQAGWLGPVTDEQWAALQARVALLGKLVNLLDKPLGNATMSYAQQIRSSGRRWAGRTT